MQKEKERAAGCTKVFETLKGKEKINGIYNLRYYSHRLFPITF